MTVTVARVLKPALAPHPMSLSVLMRICTICALILAGILLSWIFFRGRQTAGHAAFQIPFIQEGWRWLAGGVFGRGILHASPLLVQDPVIAIGSLGSLWVLRQLSAKEARLITVADGILILLFGISLLFTFGVG